MGRAFSVLLFCIRMDPILTVLDDIPRVLAVRGYIDDSTLAGDGTQPQWMDIAWGIFHSLESAGDCFEQQFCWRAVKVRMNPSAQLAQIADLIEAQLAAVHHCSTGVIAFQ